MNKTAKAKRDRATALAEARRTGDAFTVAMLEADLVDFDPQPEHKPNICGCCGSSRDPMGGCYCEIGECSRCCSPGGIDLGS